MHGVILPVKALRATSGALVVSGYLSRSYVCAVARASSFTELLCFTEFSARGVLAYFEFFFPTEFLIQCDGCWEWGWVWQTGLVAGLWLGQAFGVFLLPGFGVGSSSPQVPRHPTSMCDAGIKFAIFQHTGNKIQICPEHGNEIHVPHNRHHKVSSLMKSHQNTQNYIKYEVYENV